MRSERKSGIKEDSTFWGVSNQKDEVVIEWGKLEQICSGMLRDLFWKGLDLRCILDI